MKKIRENLAKPSSSLSKNDFISLIKEAEKGPFKPIGTFNEFKKSILNISKSKK